ncbi:hypothetical protein [Rhizobium sp. BK176]|uniref:hypothetical protein n=1 Tax=Rhizobium sp. BK176 TaxID=2587071 RepID=UPI00216885ED|nr:hypothetical protein [Rhizobium sp. BK176]MCS4090077.1 hypothetical protein [Rhizobium sp. BK176]
MASIRADLLAGRKEAERRLADDTKYSGDTIDYVITGSRHSIDIAWASATWTRDDISANAPRWIGRLCVLATVMTAASVAYLSSLALGSFHPTIVGAINGFAFAAYATFFAMVYEYNARGGFLSSFLGVLGLPFTGYFPWMRERVSIGATHAWGVGKAGIYVPRFGREYFEPYHDIIPYELIDRVEVMHGHGADRRLYPAHLLIRAEAVPGRVFEFSDASTYDGLPARAIMADIEARIAASKRTAA